MQKIEGGIDTPEENYHLIDDVISHLAVSIKKRFVGTGCNEKEITVSLMHNPSHLEGINPGSMGKTRAKQEEYNSKQQVLNIQIHGDSAFNGQGIIQESFVLGNVEKFQIGGSIHIIVNNQLGYTTSAKDSRGSFYCT